MGKKTLTPQQIKLCANPLKQLEGIKVHEAATDFHMIEPFEPFALDVLNNGQTQSVTWLDGELLDGRNRLAVAKILGIKCRGERKCQRQIPDPFAWVDSVNIFRRHSTVQQRAMQAASRNEKRIAWMKSQEGQPQPEEKKPRKKPDPPAPAGRARDRVAEQAGTSSSSVAKAAVIISGGSKDLIEAVKQNKIGLDLAKSLVNAFPNRAQQNRLCGQEQAAIRGAIQRELAKQSVKNDDDPKRLQKLARSKAQKTIEAAVRSVDDYHAIHPNKQQHKVVVTQLQNALKNLWAVR